MSARRVSSCENTAPEASLGRLGSSHKAVVLLPDRISALPSTTHTHSDICCFYVAEIGLVTSLYVEVHIQHMFMPGSGVVGDYIAHEKRKKRLYVFLEKDVLTGGLTWLCSYCNLH